LHEGVIENRRLPEALVLGQALRSAELKIVYEFFVQTKVLPKSFSSRIESRMDKRMLIKFGGGGFYGKFSSLFFFFFFFVFVSDDHLCGLVVRVSGYRYRGPGFDSRRYQIF